MARHTIYRLLLVVAIIVFVSSLLWPDVVLRAFTNLTQQYRTLNSAGSTFKHEVKDGSSLFDITKIDFDFDEQALVLGTSTTTTTDALNRNRLIIPKMGVDATVIMSDSQDALMQGLWHIPGTALPGQNGNIVIAAHRWLRRPPDPTTFYLIDTLRVGDDIFYEYGASRYHFKVAKYYIVDPEEVSILNQGENKLTLFTCTPLFSTKQRYVVNAELVSVTPL